jgi:hypothetical protein
LLPYIHPARKPIVFSTADEVQNSAGEKRKVAKQLIDVDGREVMVREDVAKAHRGVNWMALSLAAFVLLVAVVAAFFLMTATSDGDVKTPADIPERR